MPLSSACKEVEVKTGTIKRLECKTDITTVSDLFFPFEDIQRSADTEVMKTYWHPGFNVNR